MNKPSYVIEAETRENLMERATALLSKLNTFSARHSALTEYVREWSEFRRENAELTDRLDNEERLVAA
jgi:hypothetical protein